MGLFDWVKRFFLKEPHYYEEYQEWKTDGGQNKGPGPEPAYTVVYEDGTTIKFDDGEDELVPVRVKAREIKNGNNATRSVPRKPVRKSKEIGRKTKASRGKSKNPGGRKRATKNVAKTK